MYVVCWRIVFSKTAFQKKGSMEPNEPPLDPPLVQGRQSRRLLRVSGRRAALLSVAIVREVRDACVDTKPRGTEATCIVSLSGDRPKPTFSQCEQQKALRWPVNEATVKICVCSISLCLLNCEIRHK